jgi:hypothetical protein
MPVLDALALPQGRLQILYNEAERQRWLNAAVIARANGDKTFVRDYQKILKVHGDYTEGFHDKELDALRDKFQRK